MNHNTKVPTAFMNLLCLCESENMNFFLLLSVEIVPKYIKALQLREAILQKNPALFQTLFKSDKWQVQQLKEPIHLRFLTRIDERILGLLSEHFYHDPFLHGSFPKFENQGHESGNFTSLAFWPIGIIFNTGNILNAGYYPTWQKFVVWR